MTYLEQCERLDTEELLARLRRGLVDEAQAIVLEVLEARGVSPAAVEQILASEARRKEDEQRQQDRLASRSARLAGFAIDVTAASLTIGLIKSLLAPLADGAEELLILFVGWGYLLLRDAIPGGSLGKRALKIRVVRIPGERRMSLGASFFRNLPLPLMIDALLILGERRMRLGDMVAGTIVLRRDAPGACIHPEVSPPAQQNP